MRDVELADILIERLNDMLVDPAVRHDLQAFFKFEVVCTKATAEHPTIQVRPSAIPGCHILTLLGLLNGLVGTLPSGPKEGWGYITAVFDDDDHLVQFLRTDVTGLGLKKEPAP